MGHHVVGDDDVGRSVLVADVLRQIPAEEGLERRNACLTAAAAGPGAGSTPRTGTPRPTNSRNR